MVLGTEVTIGSISKELKNLIAEDTSRTNACMMNLAIFTEDVTQLEKNYQHISKLTENHSCRALSVGLDRHAPEKKTTCWVSAHCNMSNGKKTVCSEQLTFLLEGRMEGRMRNMVFANVNSDLPLVFWWQGELTDAFEPSLYTLMDRFIFNSCEWANPKESYQQILTTAGEKSNFVMQDLAWTQSYHFRLAFAAIFDEEIARNEFVNLNKLELSVDKKHKSAGLLLIAWIATQSNWSLSSINGDGFHFSNQENQEIKVTLSTKGDLPLSKLTFSSGTSSFTVLQNEGEDYTRQIFDCPTGTSEMTSAGAITGEVALVADQLSRGGKNSLLRKTLPMFIQLCG